LIDQTLNPVTVMSVTINAAPDTVRFYVQWAAARFEAAGLYYGHGTDNAHDEAVYLVFAALDMPFDCPESMLDIPLEQEQRQRLEHLVRERIETRKPTAYLVHKAWFCGLPFYVDEHVLIPRSPIAELIEQGFTPWLQPDKVRRILDIGTGSGCIAIACAYAFPEADVDAVDNDPAALAVTRRNIEAHQLTDRVHAIESDLFGAVGGPYDLIIANLPYVSTAEMDALPPEYRHEPAVALAAGDDGLDVVRRLLAEARGHLVTGGILVVEVGNARTALDQAFPELPFVWLEFERGGEGVCLLGSDDLPC
jgi:ribosomal protein L3 glutamine methyltransferase